MDLARPLDWLFTKKNMALIFFLPLETKTEEIKIRKDKQCWESLGALVTLKISSHFVIWSLFRDRVFTKLLIVFLVLRAYLQIRAYVSKR